MTWQDAVIACTQVVFIIALLPALLCDEKPPKITCLVTGSMLYVLAGTFASLHLWWGAGTAFVCASCWFVLMLQRRVFVEREMVRRARERVSEDFKRSFSSGVPGDEA